jgi:hypothetical protein
MIDDIWSLSSSGYNFCYQLILGFGVDWCTIGFSADYTPFTYSSTLVNVHSAVLAVHWTEHLLLKGLCKLTIASIAVATAQAQEKASKKT